MEGDIYEKNIFPEEDILHSINRVFQEKLLHASKEGSA